MVDTTEPSVGDLVRLARDGSRSGRRVLLDNVTDLFLANENRLTDRERAIMGDILRKLVSEVEGAVRKSLAERLSRVPGAPHDLIVVLANDEIEVARPVLMQSRVLRDPDLIEIIKHRGREHLLAIALRSPLSEMVSGMIVETADEDAVLALLKNPDARISRHAFEHVVVEAERVDSYQEPLVRRQDLPADLAMKLYWSVSAALRAYILARHEFDETMLDDFIEDTTRVVAEADDRDRTAEATAADLVRSLAERDRLDLDFAITALRQGKIQVFLAAFARLARVPAEMARRIFFDAGPESLAIVLRGIGADRATYSTLFLLGRQARDKGVVPPAELNQALRFFDTLTRERAGAALAYWRRSPAYAAAVTDLASDAAGLGLDGPPA
jgi:uncharacterized protein (DUF2336 family)